MASTRMSHKSKYACLQAFLDAANNHDIVTLTLHITEPISLVWQVSLR